MDDPNTVLAAVSDKRDASRPVVFFDGVCGLCNAFVDRVLDADRERIFLFAPIQGETARRMLPPLARDPQEWSIAYLDANGVRERADAVLEICRRLGGVWRLLGLLRFLPRRIRDRTYRAVARKRYDWFGRRETCRVPTKAEKSRFLP